MSDVVGVTMVQTENEAELACGLLRSDGIECAYRRPEEMAADAFWDWREIVVHEPDLERARELLDVQDDPRGTPPAA